jgi:tripeptide aminopeptidase
MGNESVNRQRLIDRFLRYVAIDTSADGESKDYPSSPNQRQLAHILADDLKSAGIADVQVDEHALVWAFLPSNIPSNAPTLIFNSHLDTSPEAPAAPMRPRVIERYDGLSIKLDNGVVIDQSNTPELPELIGKTLIVTDGNTLLGGDDKAGVAAIVEMATMLIERNLPHGPIRILFTCDEEIGRGTEKADIIKCKADFGYTLDGGGEATIEAENFSADGATITFTGHNIHPAIAKGRMINALRAASQYVALLPIDQLAPEVTDGRDGFLHPYRLDGHVGHATLKVLLRDFDTARLSNYKSILDSTADKVRSMFPGLEIDVDVQAQYRNMADGIKQAPQVVELALQAYRNIGVNPKQEIIRGGTDGAMFTAKGIPMPNLAVGQHNIHSIREFVCADEMETAIRHALELCRLVAVR